MAGYYESQHSGDNTVWYWHFHFQISSHYPRGYSVFLRTQFSHHYPFQIDVAVFSKNNPDKGEESKAFAYYWYK